MEGLEAQVGESNRWFGSGQGKKGSMAQRGACILLQIGIGLLACMGIVGQEAPSESKPSSPAPPMSLQEYLAHPPWIRYAYWLRSGNHNPIGAGVLNIERTFVPPEWQKLEGAIQPGGFYVIWLYNPANCWSFDDRTKRWSKTENSPLCKQQMIYGADSQYWWQLVIDPESVILTLTPREGQPGWDPNNEREIVFRDMGYEPIRTIQMLGIPELSGAESLEWEGTNRFVAHPKFYKGQQVSGMKIEGTIVTWTNAWPLRIRYRVSRQEDQRQVQEEWEAWYRYEGSLAWPPKWIYRQRANGKGPVYTNEIVRLEWGINPAHERGYPPQQFIPKNRTIAQMYVESNAQPYRISSSGTMVALAPTPPEKTWIYQEYLRRRKARVYRIVAILAVAGLTGLLVLVGLSRRLGAKREE